jgi:hypothetical protein
MLVKIAGPVTLMSSTNAGTARSYPLPPMEGGNGVRSLRYEVRVLSAGSSNVKVAVRLLHGPDRTAAVAHSTPIASTQLSSTPPLVLGGDADSSKILGECLHVVIDVDSATNGETWACLELYEMRKPF